MNLGVNLRVNKCGWLTLLLIIYLIIFLRSDTSSSSASGLVSIKALLKGGVVAAERGGKAVLKGREEGLTVKSKGKTLEGANDPVTSADFASNCAMYYGLRAAFPKVQVKSEESEAPGCAPQEPFDIDEVLPGHKDIEWLDDEYVYAEDVTVWIDPLDATQEYTEKLHQYVTTMVCVAIKGVPIVGVVHFPFSGRTVWAWYTKLVSNNVRQVAYSKQNKESPKVIVSRSHQGDAKAYTTKVFGDKVAITPAGGAGFKVMSVAEGTSDVYLHTTAIKKWDICAGNAIINSLNGSMTTLSGKTIRYAANSGEKNSDGILVTLYDHDYYLSKIAAKYYS